MNLITIHPPENNISPEKNMVGRWNFLLKWSPFWGHGKFRDMVGFSVRKAKQNWSWRTVDLCSDTKQMIRMDIYQQGVCWELVDWWYQVDLHIEPLYISVLYIHFQMLVLLRLRTGGCKIPYDIGRIAGTSPSSHQLWVVDWIAQTVKA